MRCLVTISVKNIGVKARKKRGNSGIRITAKEIGISASTLSRIENGRIPDLDTFAKLCKWLKVDPSNILGLNSKKVDTNQKPVAKVHFRKDPEVKPKTAEALASMILAAQRAMQSKENHN